MWSGIAKEVGVSGECLRPQDRVEPRGDGSVGTARERLSCVAPVGQWRLGSSFRVAA